MILTFKLINSTTAAVEFKSNKLKEAYKFGCTIKDASLYHIEECEGENEIVDICDLEYLLKNYTLENLPVCISDIPNYENV